MEDDKIRQLFENFEPDLSSDVQFINRLERKLNSVEIIVKHNAEVRSRNKKAVGIAACVGFIVGFLFSLALPYLRNVVAQWQLTLPGDSVMNTLADHFAIIAWCLIALISVISALNAYDLSRSLLHSNHNV